MGGDATIFCQPLVVEVSIHAPAWGATTRTSCKRFPRSFQSTPPHGGRPLRNHGKRRPVAVSIHAPAWGATSVMSTTASIIGFQSTPPHGGRLVRLLTILSELSFNPRPRMGGDRLRLHQLRPADVSIHAPAWGATLSTVAVVAPSAFQSTPPHGGRRISLHYSQTSHGFNPRPRMGGDLTAADVADIMHVSIHAPAWGATVMHIINTF